MKVKLKVACLWFHSPVKIVSVAEACLRFGPQICIREDRAVFIEIGKCSKLYSEATFRARVQIILRRMDLSANLAIGSDIPDSLVLAKYKCFNLGELPLASLLDLFDPFNQEPLARKQIQKMICSFRDLGIQNLAQFQKIPAKELSSRFGAIGLLCRQRVAGERALPWPQWTPEEIITERTDFPYFEFYGELDPILFELKKHLDRIFQRLWSRGLKVQKIRVLIQCEATSITPNPSRSFDFEFLFPQSNTKGALNVIKERLYKDFGGKPIQSPIEALETRVLQTVIGSSGQKNFFHQREELAEQLCSIVNQLSEIHGKENIFQALLTEDRRPEFSWKRANHLLPEDNSISVDLVGRIPKRPTYLLGPERIQVTAGFLHIRKKKFKIAKWPESAERISGGWIESSADAAQNTFDRNYYQVEIEGGALISIFETPDKEFFLHGYFG